MKFRFTDKKHTYEGRQIPAVIIILSLFTVVFQAIAQNGINPLGYLSYFNRPAIFLYNFLPVFSLYLIFFAITDSLRASFFITNIPLTLFLIINELKILFRDEPFKPMDLTLITETANMLESYKLTISPKIIVTLIIAVLSSVIVAKKLRNIKYGAMKRLICGVLGILIIFGLWSGVYSDYSIFNSTKILGNEYREADVFANKGFIFSFLSSFSGVKYNKPEGYSKEKAEEILSGYTPRKNEEIPNIIMIMSEAFFDPQNAEKLEFVEGMNPLDEYNKIKEKSMSGYIFVPGFAGGTAQTEFEAISGANVTLIDPSMPTIYKNHIKKSAYTLTAALKEKGFSTVAIHPGYQWFYNRLNVYKSFGFDNSIFMENLPTDVEKINYYVSDEVTTSLIIDNYKKHLSETPDKGYFNFTVTIQNHGPYKESKPEKQRIVRPEGITDTEYNILENYLDNLSDASNLIKDVTEYADSVDKPTVIVFFGDHLPLLDAENKDYTAIGYSIGGGESDAVLRQYSTPYLIWGNKAFRSNKATPKKEGGFISSNYLPAKLLEYIDADLSPFYMFVKEASESAPVISGDVKIYNGEYIKEIPDSLEQLYSDYRILQYYNLNEYKKQDK